MAETTIVILIDGLGFELARRYEFRPKAFGELARLETILGFSGAALASIFTGLWPDEHGLWMMYSFAESSSPFSWLRMLPASVSSRRLWLRRLMRWNLEVVHRVKGYYSLYDVPRAVLPHLDIPAREDIFAAGGAGRARTIFDVVSQRRLPSRVWDYHGDEEGAFRELIERAGRGDGGFYLLYTARLDAELHRTGTGGAGIPSRLEWYARMIAKVEQAASAGGRSARIFVLGDHGMGDVTKHVDVMASVGSLGLDIPRDFVPFYDSTMARFKVRTERARGALMELLSAWRFGRVLTEAEKERLHVSFGDGRFGDVIFLVEPGSIILPSFMGREPVVAMHGYDPAAPCMPSVLLSNTALPSRELSICDVASIVLPGFQAARGGRRDD